MNKGKVILVSPPPDFDKEMYKRCGNSAKSTPLGILLLASMLEKNGFACRVIDGQVCNCHSELLNELSSNEVLCIGISVMSSQYKSAVEISLLLKQKKISASVIWGGFHPTIFPEKTISNSFVDFVVCGEGDKALLKLCHAIRDGGDFREVGNILYKDGENIIRNSLEPLSDFNELPHLNWNLLGDVERYIKKENDLGEKARSMEVITGLGCNFKCSFCHNAIFKKRHRMKEAIDIIDEMNSLHEKYGIDDYWLIDENFFAYRKRVDEFLELLEQNKFKFRWATNLRANYVNSNYLDKNKLKRIAKLGGYYFGVGAESGSSVVLQKLRKGISTQNIITLAEWTKDIDLTICYSFIAGIPGESCNMTLETLRIIEKIKQINHRSFFIGPQVFRPYPGSPLYKEAVENGLKEPEDWNSADNFLETLSRFKKIDIETIPWHKEPHKFKYMMLSFFVLQIKSTSVRNVFKKIILKFFKFLSLIRLKMGFYTLFIEKPFLNFINKQNT